MERSTWWPSFWNFRGRPLKMTKTEAGGSVLWFNPSTREWEPYNMALAAILKGDPDAEELSAGDFERWVGELQDGVGEEEARIHMLLGPTSFLVEGNIEEIDGNEVQVGGRRWQTERGLLPSIHVGDWVQLGIGPEGAVVMQFRPGRQ